MKLWEIFIKNKGLTYGLLNAVLLTTQANMTKFLIFSSHYSYITFVRCLFLVFTLPLIEFDEATSCDTTDLILYLASAVMVIISFGTAALSFTFMGVGDSTAVEFGGGVILVGVIGHFVLDEKLSISYFILLLVDCVGIVLVAKPSFIFGTSEGEIKSKEVGAVVALCGAIAASFFTIFTRKLENRKTLHCFLLTAVQGLVGMAVCGAWTTVESAWETPDGWLKLCTVVGYGLVSTMQIVFAAKALAHVEAKNFSMMITLTVVLSYVLQLTVFEEEVDWVSVVGAAITVVCVVLSASWDYVLRNLNRPWHSYERIDDATISRTAP